MTILNIVSGPIVGCMIGYFTNYLAIKMLFKPLNPVKIGKYTLPFTPGIVPKRKNQLGGVLGNAVVEKFFTYDDLEKIFLSDYFKNAVTNSVTDYFYTERIKKDPKISNLESIENSQNKEMLEKIKTELCIRILAGFLNSDLSNLIANEGPNIFKKAFNNSTISKLLSEDIISAISKPLGKELETFILKSGKNFVMPMLDREFEELSSQTPLEILTNLEIEKDALKNILDNIYTSFMVTHTRSIVEHIDVSGIIEAKIVDMSAKEIEDLSLSVIKRELNYIVLLGAFIGGIIGATNIFI